MPSTLSPPNWRLTAVAARADEVHRVERIREQYAEAIHEARQAGISWSRIARASNMPVTRCRQTYARYLATREKGVD